MTKRSPAAKSRGNLRRTENAPLRQDRPYGIHLKPSPGNSLRHPGQAGQTEHFVSFGRDLLWRREFDEKPLPSANRETSASARQWFVVS